MQSEIPTHELRKRLSDSNSDSEFRPRLLKLGVTLVIDIQILPDSVDLTQKAQSWSIFSILALF